MTLSFEKEGNRFRVKWQGNSIDWFPDTASNRKAVLVFLRYFRDESGKHLPFKELSKLVDSEKRQASSGHVEGFRECGSDFLPFLTRKRKIHALEGYFAHGRIPAYFLSWHQHIQDLMA